MRLIGDEMLVWSDYDGQHGPGPVRGPALQPFLAAARGRVLVAGPHDPALLAGLPDVTVLVRGVPDAEMLARDPGLTVLCGSPAELSAEGPFDTIVALAGLDRLDTAESAGMNWAELLGVLRGALAPDGVLLLGASNDLGVHRLAAPPPVPDDGAWVPGPDATRPRTVDGLRRAVGEAAAVYAVFPDPVAPALVLPEGAEGGAVEAALAAAFADIPGILHDPATLAIDSVRHGLGTALAPGWIVVAARDAAQVPRVACGPATASPGPTLASAIARAAAHRDLPLVRHQLTRWQQSPAAGVPAGQVVDTPDGELVALGPAGEPGRALLDLAARLLRPGFPHPWPAVTGPVELARLLAAMTGRTIAVPDSAPDRALPVGELVADRERLARELAEARAQAAFFATELTAREADLRRVRRMVELLSGTGPARAGQAFVGGVRAARRVLRRPG
ncbi:hypothetical protein [Actinoplanes sp. N902-109]|uniref:hypothetical protein n=1 Tax=Actinoplanes sp. (strain N902-109) TaxID=649831 RepID=UPI000329603D|nr:hypothetical protein [Actinoplanes sp. N902-109]AGL17880.1 hypothetical protein L083_4370 [Actinoplanes sp. N902-109]